jgi:hypothetical protein
LIIFEFAQDSFDIDSIADPIDRQSVLAQVNNFGQTPMQLFTRPHPARKSAMAPSVATHCELSSATHVATVPNSVSSLVYVGTGDVQSAVQTNENSATLVESIVEVSHTTLPAQLTQSTTAAQQPVKTEQRNDVNVRAVGSCRVLLPPIFDRFLEFGHADCSLRVGVCDNVPNSNILRMHPAHKPGDLLCIWENLLSSFKDQSRNGTSKSLNFAELVVDSAGISKPEQISSVSVSDDGRLVFVGGERGSLCVLRIRTPEELLRQNEAARKSHVAQVQLRQQQLARYGQAVTASQQAQQQLIETSSAQSSTASKALQHIGSALAGAASAALRPMSSALQQASMALQDSFGSFSQSLYKAAPAPATLTAVDAGAEFCRQPFELVGFLRGGHCDGAGS